MMGLSMRKEPMTAEQRIKVTIGELVMQLAAAQAKIEELEARLEMLKVVEETAA